MQSISTWFRSDPRRLCVLGVWLSLAGLVVTAAALSSGRPVPALLAGIALSSLGCWAKVAGRDRFRLQRVSRRRAGSLPAHRGRALPTRIA